MFKLFEKIKLWNGKSSEDLANSETQLSVAIKRKSDIDSTIRQADILWQQGQLTEAITLYREVIKQDPNATRIYQQLAIALKQQGNIALAYEQIATIFKEEGDTQEAANYYRQAIVLKALTWEAKEKYLRSNPSKSMANRLKNADLSNMAFSFQPLLTNTPFQQQQTSFFKDLANIPSLSGITGKKPTQENTYIHLALEYSEQQNWEKVAIACKKAVSINPNQAEAYKIWGNAVQRMGKTAEAMEHYAKVVSIEPNLAKVYAKIGDLYAQQQKWEQALEYYQKAIVINPNFLEVYRQLAIIWQKLGQSQKALECNYQIVQLEAEQKNYSTEVKENKQLYLTKSASISTIEQLLIEPEFDQVKAESAFLRGNTFDSVEAYQELARTCEQQNKWQEAALYYRQALEINKSKFPKNHTQKEHDSVDELENFPRLEHLLGIESLSPQDLSLNNSDILLTLKAEEILPTTNLNETQLDKAIRRYWLQAKLHPDSAKIQNNLGSLYAKKREWEIAANYYRQAIALDSNYAEAYLNLGKVLAHIDQENDSSMYLYQALTLKPELASAEEHCQLANNLRQEGKQEAAIACYERAISLTPSLIKAYYGLAELLSYRGKKAKAIEYYQQAIEFAPYTPESYYRLGQELIRQNKWNKAVEAFSRVLELEPGYLDASYQLNRALAQKLRSNLSSNVSSSK